MKKILFLLILGLILTGCSKGKELQFCEGSTPDGKGVNCGKKFETGDLTCLIKSPKPFGTNTIEVQIFEYGEKKNEKVETVGVQVKPDSSLGNATLSFYRGGKFKVVAMNNKDKIGEADIEIVEQ